MMTCPAILNADNLIRDYGKAQREVASGKWVEARPITLGGFGQRIRATWLVATGQADALQWTEQG